MQDDNKLLKIFGTQELVNTFQEMDIKLQNTILNKSFKKASKLIIDAARGNLGGRYKRVAASLTQVYQKDIQTMSVGASRKKGGHMAHWADSGTKERSYETKNGELHKTGRIIGTGFWSKALNSTTGSVEETIYKSIEQEFNKLIQKNNKL